MNSSITEKDALLAQAIELFEKQFSSKPNCAACAPGRVNLIGEHTDYNEGFVLPMALPFVTIVVGHAITSPTSHIVTDNPSVDKPLLVEFIMPSKECPLTPGVPKWANYLKGVVANYIYDGDLPSFEAAIVSNVPTGGGLSSSASLEVAMYTFLDALTAQKDVDPVKKALACQKAEHDFAGMPCGIMDQFISVLGKKGSALLIDCRTNTSTLVPLEDPEYIILITNSNVKHELTGSEYSTRRSQCQKAASLLQISSLREAKESDIIKLRELNAEPDIIKRARHVVKEISRTSDGAEALRNKKYERFGQLMYESHISLKDDYEVSCEELDVLVEAAMKVKGVLGSRMTGGGFGGCTVTLVRKDAVNNAIENIKKSYTKDATFYICTPSEGAQILSI